MNGKILIGDVLEKIKEIPDESVDCVITSPPYWGLRDYGTGDAQWGLEGNFNEYLDKLDLLMNECWRVLKKTGTCWINLGDTYSGGGGKAVEQSFNRDRNIDTEANPNTPAKSKYRHRMGKSRFGIPERFYVRCIDNGWIARNHIPWVKANSMPSSVADRFTNKWESVFFFAKAKKYYFNLDAVRVPTKGEYKPFNRRVREAKRLKASGDEGAIIMAKMSDEEEGHTDKNGFRIKTKYGDSIAKTKNIKSPTGSAERTLIDLNTNVERNMESRNRSALRGKNPGDVFEINTRPFAKAHFATFPPALPEKILKCACPKGCVVLDPFFGAGTVGLVADQLELNWIGIELKEEYAEIARERIGDQEKLTKHL